jgi:putative transposase
MARKPRFNLPGYPQHVIQRGNNRQPCFFTQEDHLKYREALVGAANRTGCQIHAYVLMTNHVHLLITPATEHGLGELMQSVGRRYVRYVNYSYGRTGTLWEGRYRASLVQSEKYLLTCYRYIELNPVRAGMVGHPGEYRWSSYAANAEGSSDAVVCPHSEYTALGGDAMQRCRVYRELFSDIVEADALHAIRKTVNGEFVLGNDRFKDEIEHQLARRVRPGKRGRPRAQAG